MEAAHTPEEAAQRLGWSSSEDPGEWRAIIRRFRDGHEERWWAAEVKTLIGYGPEESVRLVAVTTDPATLPANSSWYLTTNLPAPETPRAEESPLACASLVGIHTTARQHGDHRRAARDSARGEGGGGKRRGERKGASSSAVMAASSAAGAKLIGSVGKAVALLEGVVEGAPAASAAGAA